MLSGKPKAAHLHCPNQDAVSVRLPSPRPIYLSRPCSCFLSVPTSAPAWQACAPALAIILGLYELM